MNTYIMFMQLTEQGASDIAEAKRGRDAGKKAAAAMGVSWKRSYLVMGEHDVIVIAEAPDDETMAKFALMGLTGSLSITTMRAFNEAETDKLVKDLQPPPG